jgi:hypothetical protein
MDSNHLTKLAIDFFYDEIHRKTLNFSILRQTCIRGTLTTPKSYEYKIHQVDQKDQNFRFLAFKETSAASTATQISSSKGA